MRDQVQIARLDRPARRCHAGYARPRFASVRWRTELAWMDRLRFRSMKRTSYFLSCFAATAVLLGAHASVASKRSAPSVRSGAMAELEMQVLLDRVGFSPGEIDGEPGKNAREALAAFRAARGFPAGARGRKSLLLALGAGSIEPIVPHTITAEEAAGPFVASIPQDMTEQSNLAGLYYTSLLEALGEKFHSAP